MDYGCKDCQERKHGCHDTCEKYLKIKEKNEKEKAERRKYLENSVRGMKYGR